MHLTPSRVADDWQLARVRSRLRTALGTGFAPRPMPLIAQKATANRIAHQSGCLCPRDVAGRAEAAQSVVSSKLEPQRSKLFDPAFNLVACLEPTRASGGIPIITPEGVPVKIMSLEREKLRCVRNDLLWIEDKLRSVRRLPRSGLVVDERFDGQIVWINQV
jgi:hypothetical protein